MAEIIPMLALSPTMEQATIVKWTRAEGDAVEAGEVLCEVETDKAVMEYEAGQDGVLLKILIGEGGSCGVGDPIAIVGEAGEDIEALVVEAGAAKPAAEPVAEAVAPIEQPVSVVEVEPASAEPAPVEAPPAGRIVASPVARKLAEQVGLDLRTIAGSGPGGRIIKRDVQAAMAKPAGAKAALAGEAAPELAEQVTPVSPKRRMIAQRLSESKFSAPHYYVTSTVAMDELLAVRSEINESAEEKVSLNAFLIAFAAGAIARHPTVNSSWEGDTIHTHGRVDVALAVAQEDGLITPVVRDCSRKGLMAIDADLRGLIAKAQAGLLGRKDYAGATFTISNLGRFGVEQFTAVINPPGSAILAIGEIRPEPVIDEDGELVVRSNMKMTLSCDHRVIDGVVAAAFMQELKSMLQNPTRPTLVVPM